MADRPGGAAISDRAGHGAAGEPLTIRAVLTNNKVGHDFPTGPLDIIQSWVEISVTDQAGRVVFRQGQRDTANFIAPGAFMLKAEPVDQYGNLIDRHNLWGMVGVCYRRSMVPGASERAGFGFSCPGTSLETQGGQRAALEPDVAVRAPLGHVPTLPVSARLMYRLGHQAIFVAVGIAGAAIAVTLEGRGELARAEWGWWTARVAGALLVINWWGSRGLLRAAKK